MTTHPAYERCPSCGHVETWSSGRLVCPSRTCPEQTNTTKETTDVSILSIRALATIARREHARNPHITRTELLARLVETGADADRARRGLDLAASRGLSVPEATATERAA